MADAAICAWDAQYTYNNWRPVTAIRAGEHPRRSGDRAPDATWSSFIATPPVPRLRVGHSTFSAAAAAVLAMFYGTRTELRPVHRRIPNASPGVSRSFASFSAAAAEAAMSRIYGGIHYRFASQDGLNAGTRDRPVDIQELPAGRGKSLEKLSSLSTLSLSAALKLPVRDLLRRAGNRGAGRLSAAARGPNFVTPRGFLPACATVSGHDAAPALNGPRLPFQPASSVI